MLVQDFLRKQSLEKLEEYYGIKNTRHEDGRVILNYSQIDSASVKDCKLSAYLFAARKMGTDPITEMHKNPELLLKIIGD